MQNDGMLDGNSICHVQRTIRMSLNKIDNQFRWLTKEIKHKTFTAHFEEFSSYIWTNTILFLWKSTRSIKRTFAKIFLGRNEVGTLTRRDIEKAELSARHLSNVFQPHNMISIQRHFIRLINQLN